MLDRSSLTKQNKGEGNLPHNPQKKMKTTRERIDGLSRNEVIKLIKAGLEKRSGKKWSVTGGTGTAYGWLRVDVPPARRQWIRGQISINLGEREVEWVHAPSASFGYSSPEERKELGELLGLGHPVHHQGHSIASSNAYWAEFIDRAEGKTPSVYGTPYWD